MLISKRENEPIHCMLKIKSFSFLSEAPDIIIQSDVFEANGHKWRLDLYPNGNDRKGGINHISLYVRICDTNESLPEGWKVRVYVNFFVYDHKHHNYTVFQDDDGNRTTYREDMVEWGFNKLISLESFKKSENGYLLNDSCVFGAEVFATKKISAVTVEAQKIRCMYMTKPEPVIDTYTWTIDNCSAITREVMTSEMFKVGKVKWKLCIKRLDGNGFCIPPERNADKYFSIYIIVDLDHVPSLYDGSRAVYAKYKLRFKNRSGNVVREKGFAGHWFSYPILWGYPHSVPVILFKGSLTVEAEFSIVGLLKNIN